MTSHLELPMQAFHETWAADIAAGQAAMSDDVRDSALIERWAEGGDPRRYDLDNPAIKD